MRYLGYFSKSRYRKHQLVYDFEESAKYFYLIKKGEIQISQFYA